MKKGQMGYFLVEVSSLYLHFDAMRWLYLLHLNQVESRMMYCYLNVNLAVVMMDKMMFDDFDWLTVVIVMHSISFGKYLALYPHCKHLFFGWTILELVSPSGLFFFYGSKFFKWRTTKYLRDSGLCFPLLSICTLVQATCRLKKNLPLLSVMIRVQYKNQRVCPISIKNL